MIRILFKYATRSRPALFRTQVTRYCAMLSGNHAAHFVVSCDEDDRTMKTPAMLEFIGGLNGGNVTAEVHYNPPPQTKISAINANIGTDGGFDVLFVASDDMRPVKAGYDDALATALFDAFGDGDGVLHPNDGLRRDRLITLPVMGRAYYERFSYVYHPAYGSVWADDEYTDVAHALGRVRRVHDVWVRHEWVGVTVNDWLHKRNESWFNRDRRTYLKRKAAGFPADHVATTCGL